MNFTDCNKTVTVIVTASLLFFFDPQVWVLEKFFLQFDSPVIFFACLFRYMHVFVVNVCRSERNFFYLIQWCIFNDSEGKSIGRIVLFRSSGLQKCKAICSIRRSKNIKYKNITLSKQIGVSEGYHMTCYRRFTALIKEYTKADTAQTSASYTKLSI